MLTLFFSVGYSGSTHSMPSSQTVPSSRARTVISTTAPETGLLIVIC